MRHIHSFFLLFILLLMTPSCGDNIVDIEAIGTRIESFESHVNSSDPNSIISDISAQAADYDFIKDGHFFDGTTGESSFFFKQYRFDYKNYEVTLEGTTAASAKGKVDVFDRVAGSSFLENTEFTMTFIKADGDWKIKAINQIKEDGGEIGNILRLLQDNPRAR